MAKYIMFQGTSSHVGKSILTAAFCRTFARKGCKVVPFKAQNMALNSFVTPDGGEMGRAQVAQAEAAMLVPETDMNPVLLKPVGNSRSQVIIRGVPVGTMSASEYHLSYSVKAFEAVKEALQRLDEEYELIVLEGAGSPAEVNLKDTDIVNMRVAKYLNAPVFLVADIDRGGSLDALVGTLELLEPEERDLVKGLIINKFRGDPHLFEPAVTFLEEKTGKPVIGVMPYIDDLGIDEEDSVSLAEKPLRPEEADIKIGVLLTPRISNFTDFDALASERDVSLYYVKDAAALAEADVLILPGSKNTTEDLLYLRLSGLEEAVKSVQRRGIPIVGICGGYQMLGRSLADPHRVESDRELVQGMGLLPMETVFTGTKLTAQVCCACNGLDVFGQKITVTRMLGYEIHMGQTTFTDDVMLVFELTERKGRPCNEIVGAASVNAMIFGTYVHGLFDNDEFRNAFLNALRRHKGLAPLTNRGNYRQKKDECYDRLADLTEASLDMDAVYAVLGEQSS